MPPTTTSVGCTSGLFMKYTSEYFVAQSILNCDMEYEYIVLKREFYCVRMLCCLFSFVAFHCTGEFEF